VANLCGFNGLENAIEVAILNKVIVYRGVNGGKLLQRFHVFEFRHRGRCQTNGMDSEPLLANLVVPGQTVLRPPLLRSCAMGAVSFCRGS
jgi:hypothetical protein